ncbi:MAG: hypothetical protein JO268_06695 [Pseudonocardiales bacterium]|nr:hypothetical protein [Pseudonocardiales bacterium]
MTALAPPVRDPARAARQPQPAGHDELSARAAGVRALEGVLGSTPWPVSTEQTPPVRRWAQRLLDARH